MADAKEETSPEHINLKVMGQDGNIVQFKIKKHTALKKLMSTYCERAGLALQTIRFSFDGTRINESDTPKSLEMEDGDTIEVFQQQSGGRRFTDTCTTLQCTDTCSTVQCTVNCSTYNMSHAQVTCESSSM
ncbi:small ubiquitin-related modifier 3 [Eurytemora carolleeae]|uniref:small ubiquitin-related modifier 3 n=1 Tax=Eurytemora carolleeae TaxID=1294199 RepID=UPI000C774450|nr:small ubiquitin-related modifier 3 [Eurytemora carolleeae]|eukprot:XP_023324837.1 small ubiquitin-related modifier 3-like [Eurytemora affinis]